VRGRPPSPPRQIAAPVITEMLLAEALTVEEIAQALQDLKPVGNVRVSRKLRPAEVARIDVGMML